MAMRVDIENLSEDEKNDFNGFMDLRVAIQQAQEKDKSVEELGESEIDGRRVVGYRFVEMGMSSTVWADAQTYQVVQVEMDMGEAVGQQMSIVMRDWEVNVELDEELFSLEVPEGYDLRQVGMDMGTGSEEDLIEGLRFWAELSEGSFPGSLDFAIVQEMTELLGEKGLLPDGSEGSMQEHMDRVSVVMRMLKFVTELPAGSDWHYAGEGVEYGDGETAIFWYRPAGSEDYRVGYGDLAVEELPAGAIPE
jgi:hypothetical protein